MRLWWLFAPKRTAKGLCLKTGNAITIEGFFPLDQFFDRKPIALKSFGQADGSAAEGYHQRSFRPSAPSLPETRRWQAIYNIGGPLVDRSRAAHGERPGDNNAAFSPNFEQISLKLLVNLKILSMF